VTIKESSQSSNRKDRKKEEKPMKKEGKFSLMRGKVDDSGQREIMNQAIERTSS
jgi:hypothetical protein